MENPSHARSPTVAISSTNSTSFKVEESPYSVGSAPQLTDDDNTINLNSSFNQINSPSPHKVSFNQNIAHQHMSHHDSPYDSEDSLNGNSLVGNMNQQYQTQGKRLQQKMGNQPGNVNYSDPNSNALRIYQMDYNNNNNNSNNNNNNEEPNRAAFKPLRPPPLLISSQQKQHLHQQLINHYSPTSSSYLSSAPPSILSSTLSSGYNTSPMIQQHRQNQDQGNHGSRSQGIQHPSALHDPSGTMHKYGGPSEGFDEVNGAHTADSDSSFNLHPPNSSYLDYHYGSGGSISGGSESGSVSGIPPEPPKELYGNLLAMSSDSSLYEQAVNRQHAFQQPLFKLNMGDSNSDILSDLQPNSSIDSANHHNFRHFNSSSGDLGEFEHSEALVDLSAQEDRITTIPPSMIGNNAEIATTADNRNSQATITGFPGVQGLTPSAGYANPQNVSLGLPGDFMYSLSELEFGNPSFDLVVDSSFDDTSGFPTFANQHQDGGVPTTNLAQVATGSSDNGQHIGINGGNNNNKAYPHQNPLLMTRHLQTNSDTSTTPLTSFDTYLSDSNSHSFINMENNANNGLQSSKSISKRRAAPKNLMLVQHSPSTSGTQEDDVQSSPLMNPDTDIQQFSPRHLMQRRRLQHQRSPLREHTEAPPQQPYQDYSFQQGNNQQEYVPQLQQAHYQNQFNDMAQHNYPDAISPTKRKTMLNMMYNGNGHMSQQLQQQQMYNGFPSILSNVPTSAPPLAPLPPLPPFEDGNGDEQHPSHRHLGQNNWQKSQYPQLNTFYHNGKKPPGFSVDGQGIPIPQGFPPPPPMGMHPVGSSGASSDRSDSSVGLNGMVKKKHTRRRLLPRSKNGCWICRIKHLKCDEKRPVCGSCSKFGIVCDYSPQKPDYVLDKNVRKQKLVEISLVRKLKHKDGRKK